MPNPTTLARDDDTPDPIMKRIVNFSAGRGSWGAAKRTVAKHGAENVLLLSADTNYEEDDYYRFHADAVKNIGAEPVVIADGRTPWQVFRDERFLGNSRIDPCSKILKRQLLDRWRSECYTPETAIIVIGIGWWEVHRLVKIRERLAPWQVEAPMCDKPYMDPKQIDAWMRSEGLEPPAAYAEGWSHNNCGGRCVKQGQAGWRRLWRTHPDRYAECEREENALREYLDKDVSIMTEQRGGQRYPLTLATFRERLERDDAACDLFDEGGCGCGV